MDEYLSFDKGEKGCNVYITINCGKDCKKGKDWYPDGRKDDDKGEDRKDDSYKPIDWEKYMEKKPYPEPCYDKNGFKCPAFVTNVTNNLFVEDKKHDDKKS